MKVTEKKFHLLCIALVIKLSLSAFLTNCCLVAITSQLLSKDSLYSLSFTAGYVFRSWAIYLCVFACFDSVNAVGIDSTQVCKNLKAD